MTTTLMKFVIHCANPRCGKASLPTAAQESFIERSAKKGMRFIMIDCPVCGSSMPFNPQHPDGADKQPIDVPQLRCPVESCEGWVCEVEDFWGCGECGNIWPNREAVEAHGQSGTDSKKIYGEKE